MFNARNTLSYDVTIYALNNDSIKIPAYTTLPVGDEFLARLPLGVINIDVEQASNITIFDGSTITYGPFDSTNTTYKQIGEPDSKVIIVKNNVIQGTAQTDETGRFSFTLSSPVLPTDIIYPIYVKTGKAFTVSTEGVPIEQPGADGDFTAFVASVYSLGFM